MCNSERNFLCSAQNSILRNIPSYASLHLVYFINLWTNMKIQWKSKLDKMALTSSCGRSHWRSAGGLYNRPFR